MDFPRRRSRLSPKVRVGRSAVSGRGLVATGAIRAGEIVIVWGGVFADAEGARRARREGRGTMQWDDDLFSIEQPEEDPATLLNHACDPNVWMLDVFTLAARRPIATGEELAADYALWEADEAYVSAWECRCGRPDCRGRVTGRDWRQPALQERYRGHFSPLINRRIAALEAATALTPLPGRKEE